MQQFLFPNTRRLAEAGHNDPRPQASPIYLLRHFGILSLLTCLLAVQVSAQNDTPCECSQRWTEGAAWNANGTVNETPATQPKGIIRCSGTPDVQNSISSQFSCVYNPATFPITVMTCNDPITGAPIPPPSAPQVGTPIIFLNFDVRPNVGTFQIQINEDNSMDNIGWALYYSAAPTSSAGVAPQYQSGDCNNLIFYLCGEASNNAWQTFTTPTFTQPTNWYLAVWDQDDDSNLSMQNFQARFGCGNGDLYCDLNVSGPSTTCNSNGTYTVNIPITGQNGNFVGTDPNALNSPSTAVCLTNVGDGGPTMGVISLNYNYGTAYDIDIAIDVAGACPDPIIPSACTATVTGPAPDCCTIPPSCNITGPANVCPDQSSIMYTGPPGMDSYLWTITGNGTIVGSATGQSVTVASDGICGGMYVLTLDVELFTCTNQCMIDVTVDDTTAPTVTCPASVSLAACPTMASLDATFNTWMAGFVATDNCAPPFPPVTGLPNPGICGGSTSFTYTVSDDCANSNNCSSTFSVAAATPVVLTCPVSVVEAACQTQAAITAKYNAWLATATFTGGCNAVLTNNNSTAPLACGGTATVTFTVTNSCGAPVTCTSTFTVTAAPLASITCPVSSTEAACQTQAAIDAKYATWLASAAAGGGCGVVLTNNSPGAPPACGGSVLVTFTATSNCQAPLTCQSTFTVNAAPTTILTCPVNATEAACQTQAAINAKFTAWLSTAAVSGGCNAVLTNNNTGAPSACGGSTTVTFTAMSDCGPTATCMATFTVTAAPALVLTCPVTTTEAACQTQATINAKYATWLATATAVGGCNVVFTNNSTGAPSACGGAATVTFTATNSCGATQTCSSTFTVNSSPVVLNCPINQTQASCQTQAAINTAYNTWLTSATFSGGCNGVLTNNSTGPPSACGGIATVTFTVTSDCQAPVTCIRTFTVTAAPPVVLNCPINVTEAACQTQAQIDTKYAAWLATVSNSGGCNAVLTNNSPGAPLACGGTSTVTFTVTSTCQVPVTCTRTFAVSTAPAVALTCPVNTTEAACQTQAQINTKYAAWLATATATGGCNLIFNNNSTGAPLACGGSVSVTFTAASSCEATQTCTRTFTVSSASSVSLTCPVDVVETACQSQAAINTKYNAWLNSAMMSGGCNAVLTNNSTGPPAACGGTATVTFTVTSSCQANVTCTKTFTVTAAPAVNLVCPVVTTEAACQTQAAIDAKFTAWLATASVSGGCNATLTNNNTGAPSACGGTTTVVFSAMSDCGVAATCSRTFTVTAAPSVVLTCPVNATEVACQSQASINSKYALWLATATATGGCNLVFTNNSAGAPSACGGTSTVTFTATSSCGATQTCTASFTVNSSPVVLTCPIDQTETTCQTQAAIDAKYATWLASAVASGGCSITLTNNSPGAPSACGGSSTVTFTVTSACQVPVTCTRTFTVTAAPAVDLTCPINTTEAACQTQASIDAKYAAWLATVSMTGGCNAVLTNNSTGAPLACGGTTSVTFTVDSDCQPDLTCTRTFTVTAAPPVVLNCAVNVTESACQTQAAINTKYAAWLATVTTTGGCNAVLTNNSPGAPNANGGTATVTFTVTSTCHAPVVCTRTFTVENAPLVSLTCPADANEMDCQTQAQINTKYNAWLAQASFMGGCNAVLTNNSTGPPNACGGSVSVTFTVTSTSQAPVTCTRTFAVATAPVVNLICPIDVTEAACQTQAQINTKYAAWLATAVVSGGCNATLTNNSTGAPSACGGVATVTFTAMSTCGVAATCTRTFTVTAAPALLLTCPVNVTEVACQAQASIDAKYATWLATATTVGGCTVVLTNNSTGAPSACGGSKTVTFTATNSCGATQTCTATFTVNTSSVVLVCPSDQAEVACQTQAQIDTKYAAWLAMATASGGCGTTLTNNSTGVPSACGGTATVTFTVTSTCQVPVTCTRTFTVATAPVVNLTCPINVTEAACQTQAQINTKYAAWLATATASGGCNLVFTNNNPGTPNACGGTSTVTFTVTSDCEAPVTCTRTFTVTPATPVVFNCPINVTEAACQTQSQINVKYLAWLASATATGGCGTTVTNNSNAAPLACGGSVTRTFTMTTGCEATQTCTRTFTVSSAPTVSLVCPSPVTEAACQTQAEINTKYNAWIASAMRTGGCNAVLTNNGTGPPLACGGTATVTFTVTSDCQAPVTCTSTFTVTAAPVVNLTCPIDVTEAACQSTGDIVAKYNAWLATATVSGGCNAVLTNNSTGAPLACGGSKTVTFTVMSTCGVAATCTRTFTVTAAPTVVLNCPADNVQADCQTQAQVDAAYSAWLASATVSGGCNPVLTNNSTGAPLACGGSKTVVFTVTSGCQAPVTCSRTFTVPGNPVVLSCPPNQAETTCQTQAAINAKYATWLAASSVSGGCGVTLTNNSTGAPSACGGSVDVTFTATSTCQAPVTCTRTFLVNAAPAMVLTCPTARTETTCQTQAQINTKFTAWLASASVAGGCSATISNNSVAAPSACGGSVTVTFTATNGCGGATQNCTSTFTVTPASTPVLTCPTAMTMPPFSSQAQINAAFTTWLASAAVTGGCPGSLTNDNIGAPSVCGGTTNVTFTYTSPCSAMPLTCTSTFTVQFEPAGIRTAKYFAGIDYATSGTPGNFDVITEIVVQNIGSPNLNNLSILDNISAAANFGSAFVAVRQAPHVVATGATGLTTTATTNPNMNAAYNGSGDLLAGGGLLMPGERVVIQFRIEVNPDAVGAPILLRNQATAFGTVATCGAPTVVNDPSDAGPNPMTSNAGWFGDSGGTNDPTPLRDCWSELNDGLACNDLVQISLNQNCEIWLSPTMVLEGETAMCNNGQLLPLGTYYEVFMVTDEWGSIVPDLNPATPDIHEISGSYIGQTLSVKIKEKLYGNSCWGYIFIEDKMAPSFVCPVAPIQIACSADLSSVPAPVATDNCDPNPIVALLGQQTIDNNICDGTYVVRRTYKATDNHGNTSMANCVQTINIVRPPIDFPEDISWSCTQYDAFASIVNATTLNAAITDVDPVGPGIDVSSSLSNAILSATGSGTVNVANNTICGYNVLHSDQQVATCGDGFKIIRTWTVVDWCSGDIITTGVGGEDNIQIINVMDKVAPNIVRPAFEVSANVQAVGSNACRSTGLLLPPTVLTDNCSSVTVQINTPVGPATMNADNSGFIPAPGLSIGTHTITYVATDACGNVKSINVQVTVKDNIAPTTICNGVIDVDLPSSPGATATVIANLFDNGSYDNCCMHHFEARRMTDACDDGHNDTVFGPSVVFCCEDIPSSPIMVVVRAYDCHGNFNDCMVEVEVNDKLAPALVSCPSNQRITCDTYANSYETGIGAATTQAAKSQFLDAAFGQPVFADNCNSITVARTFASNLTQCKEGTITRTWAATDAAGQTSATCTQQIFVDHVSDFAVTFPADLTVNCGQPVPAFGEPTIFQETCEMLVMTHDDDTLFAVSGGTCFKIIRTWQIVNWCTQGVNIDQEVVEVPESALGLPFPQCDVDGDGDCDSRTFRDSWTATQRPTAANATVQFGPDTDPDSDPWDGVIIYKQTIHFVDLVAPVITNCTAPNVCIDGTNCLATFTIPTPTATDCSPNVTFTANTPGLGAGFGPFTAGPGTFTTVFTANDGCGNSSSCSATFTVRDCKAPSAACNSGVIVPLMPGANPMVTVNANQFNSSSSDNCSTILAFSFTPDPTTTTQVFDCDNEGTDSIQIFVTDAAGNQGSCFSFITILDNTSSCVDDTLVVNLGGIISTENDLPVGGVSIGLSGQSFGNSTTTANGGFSFTGVPVGQDVSLVPTHDVNPLHGVTTFDLVLISKHILNITLLDSPYKLIAADVNNSKTITTFDLVELRKLILQMTDDFANNTSWRFVERNYSFPTPSNPWQETFPEFININNIPSDVLNADFVAVKIGDVNNSASFSGNDSDERDNGMLIFQAKDQRLKAGETFEVAFGADDFEAMGYQFTLDFNSDLLEFVEIGEGLANASHFGLAKLDDHAITASWNEHGETNNGDHPQFSLVFKSKAEGKLSEALTLSDRFTRTEAYNREGDLQQVRLLFLENDEVAGFELYQNRPNPFNRETVIAFKLPAAGAATLTITDASGRLIKTIENQFREGYNEIRLSREELGTNDGVLYYRLASGTATASKMMLLSE